MKIIPAEIMLEKRLQKLLGEDYDPKLTVALFIRAIGDQLAKNLEAGQAIEWGDLSEREQRIAGLYYAKGLEAKQRGLL